MFALRPDTIQVNDVVLSSDKGLLRGAIRWFTKSDFSHAGIVTRPGMLLEATLSGVQRRSVAGIKAGKREWLRVLRPVPRAHGQALSEVIEELFAHPYDHLGALGSKWHFLSLANRRGTFCSKLIAVGFEKVGRPLFSDLDPSVITPGMLARSSEFSDVTGACVAELDAAHEAGLQVIAIDARREPRIEIELLRRIFRMIKAGVSYKTLPTNIASTPEVLGWLSVQDAKDSRMRKADETIANVLRYGGYVAFYKGISRKLLADARLLNSAVTTVPLDVSAPELLANLRSQLPSASAALNAKRDARQKFIALHKRTQFETFFVLAQLYLLMEEASLARVTSLNLLISTLAEPHQKLF
jgi:hypothetical protein